MTGAYSPNAIPYNPYSCASKHIALKKKIITVQGDLAVNKLKNLQNLAGTLLDLAAACRTFAAGARGRVSLIFDANGGVDGQLKYFVDARHFFTAALDVGSPHTLRNGLALFWSNRSQTLRLEKLDTCSLVAEICFESHQNKRGCGTEMEHFGVPLLFVSARFLLCGKT